MGIWKEQLIKQFIKKVGKKSYDLRVEGDAIENLSSKFREKAEKFLGEEEYKSIHRGYNVAAPNGESFVDVEKRVESFIRYLKRFIKKINAMLQFLRMEIL